MFDLVKICTDVAGVLTHSARVECFTNLNPMTAQRWPAAMQVLDVLVMTAQMFLNMLRLRVAHITEFDLLVSFNTYVSLPAGVYSKLLQPCMRSCVSLYGSRTSRTKFDVVPIFTT